MRISFFNFELSRAPINLPAIASAACANPSITNEKNIKNCISIEFTANTVSLPFVLKSEEAETAVKNENTNMRHIVLIKISMFMFINSFIFSLFRDSLRFQYFPNLLKCLK
jgi:hypothetical protein